MGDGKHAIAKIGERKRESLGVLDVDCCGCCMLLRALLAGLLLPCERLRVFLLGSLL